MELKDRRRFKIKIETDCRACIHNKVCSQKMEDRCGNYYMGRSGRDWVGCDTCLNRFGRFSDNQSCFRCFHYRRTYEDWADWEDRALSNICLIMSDPKTDFKQKEKSLLKLRETITEFFLDELLKGVPPEQSE